MKNFGYNIKIYWKEIYILKEKIWSKLTVIINVIVNNYFLLFKLKEIFFILNQNILIAMFDITNNKPKLKLFWKSSIFEYYNKVILSKTTL